MNRLTDVDPGLVLVTLTLVVMGLVTIYSASALSAYKMVGEAQYFFHKQFIWSLLGTVACAVIALVPFTVIRTFTVPLYGLSNVLLALVLVPYIGREAGGAWRWIDLGFIGFQPSELAKLAVILTAGLYLSNAEVNGKNQFRDLLVLCLITFVPVFLIALEPDIGTAFQVASLGMIMMFLAGFPLLYLVGIGLLATPVGALTIFSSGYRTERVVAYLNPWADPYDKGYHVLQSLKALSSGGFTGKGLGESTLKMGYLPEPYTDSIVSIYGEEMGFLGILLLVALFGYLVYKGFSVSLQCSDSFERIVGIGVTFLIGFQAVLNMAVVSALIPTTGVSMPFLSYGGSSLLTNMMGLGLLMNLSGGR